MLPTVRGDTLGSHSANPRGDEAMSETQKEGKGRDLPAAIDDAAKKVADLGWYTVEKIEVDVGNPKIIEYKVTIGR